MFNAIWFPFSHPIHWQPPARPHMLWLLAALVPMAISGTRHQTWRYCRYKCIFWRHIPLHAPYISS
jgi:hypothetical protein